HQFHHFEGVLLSDDRIRRVLQGRFDEDDDIRVVIHHQNQVALSICGYSIGRNGKELMEHGWHELIRRGENHGDLRLLDWKQTRGLLLNWLLNCLDRQDHRKGAALPWRAGDFYLSSQQRRQLAHNGKTQSRPSNFPRVTPISLVKG